ncbi:MAG: HAMP domain-containing protein [Acidobacteria bacterium]|nr:HAMP domain-containing protein [Acidobacteriota bacterium]
MRFFPSTLRWRLTLRYSGSLALVFVLLGGLIYALVRYQLLRHHDRMLEDAASQVEAVLSQEPDCEHLTPEQSVQLDRIGRLILFHEAGGGGRVFYRSSAALDLPIPDSHLDAMRESSRRGTFETLFDSPPVRIYSRPYQSLAGRRGIIRVAERLGDVTAPLDSLSLALILLAPLAVAASGATGYWLARNALAPVDAITRLAREIEATSLERRLPPAGTADEIGRLVRTFNQMIARLEGSFEGMKRFTADASHELRAPLARMRGAVDVVLSRPRQGDEYREVLGAIGDDVDHLRSITEDLLVLARADAGRIDLERDSVRLDVVAAEAVESLGPTADARGVAMRVKSDGPIVVLGDERWLRQLVADLLDNALKFAPLGVREEHPAEVVVRVSESDQTATLSVEDTGPGLPPGAPERVFERFFRGDTPHGHPPEDGVGLGLAIAAWIAKAHNGTITAENPAAGGSRFVVRLPRASPGPPTEGGDA